MPLVRFHTDSGRCELFFNVCIIDAIKLTLVCFYIEQRQFLIREICIFFWKVCMSSVLRCVAQAETIFFSVVVVAWGVYR
jgi:hypothetical protein